MARMVRHPWRRLAAWLVDCACILVWCAAVAAVAVPLYLAGILHRVDPLTLNVVSAAVVVVPVVLGLSARESGARQATPGKRLCRLAVEDARTGARAPFRRTLLRNSVKVGLPWIVGHWAVIELATTNSAAAPPAGVLVLTALSYLLPLVYVLSLFIGRGRTPYDRLAGTVVTALPNGSRPSPARTASIDAGAGDGLHEFARERYSPLRFDAAHTISPHEVDVLLEAARHAPSAGNSQPWSFVVGIRGDEVHQRMVGHLARSSSQWAPNASVLVANLSHRRVEGSDMEYSEFAAYDLGQAVAHLTFQAHAMGLAVHQFRAFDRDAMARCFTVPEHWEVTSMAAIGKPLAGTEHLEGAGTSRERLPLREIIWARAQPV